MAQKYLNEKNFPNLYPCIVSGCGIMTENDDEMEKPYKLVQYRRENVDNFIRS
jgi:hypothetical protein